MDIEASPIQPVLITSHQAFLTKEALDQIAITTLNNISDFEDVAAELAVKNNYEFVVCGHIHQPQMRQYTDKNESCIYLNSGDWIENLTSLEYHDQEWKLIHYQQELMESYEEPQEEIENIGLDLEELQPSFLMNSILNKKI